ncbi:MAG: DUF5678 domain-containing protein [archaeon]
MSEYDYYISTDLNQYTGKWVGILNKEVVAVGKNFKEVAEKVDKNFARKKVLITRIPEKVLQIL